MTIAEKLAVIAENEPKVYEAGKQAAYNELNANNVIPMTAAGTQYIIVNDASEIPHNVTVQLSSDTITDFSGVSVTRIGKNFVNNNEFMNADNWNVGTYHVGANYHGFYELHLKENTTYTLTWDCETINGMISLNSYQKGTTPSYSNSTEITIQYLHNNGVYNKTITFTTESGKDYGIFMSAIYMDGETKVLDVQKTLTNCIKWIQVEVNKVATAYEPYTEETYKANADGTVGNITSTRQYMTIFADSSDVTLTVGYNKSWGMQAAYDELWDNIQGGGNVTDYRYAFGGSWSDDNFKPKYDLKTQYAERMFAYSKITDLKGILERQGVSFVWNLLKNANVTQMFQQSVITRLPVIDVSNSASIDYMFYAGKNITYIEKLKIPSDGSMVFSNNVFQNCNALTDIEIEGVIGKSINFQWCPLSVASMKSIISALTNYAGTDSEYVYTVTFPDSCWTALEAESTAPHGGTWEDYVYTVLCWNV